MPVCHTRSVGRHSAGDDEDSAPAAAPVVTATPKPGRHARPSDDDEPAGERGGPRPVPRAVEVEADPVEPVEPPEPVPTGASRPPRSAKGSQSTAADLALLREHSDVRARCIAAVVVPFVLYTATMYLIGAVHLYLIWVWIPLVTAGVVAGGILDAEHRRRADDDAAPAP